MGRFQDNRRRMRKQLLESPFDFPPGLAHFLASVVEPRSDASEQSERVNGLVTEHQENLITEIEKMLPSDPSGAGTMRSSGGRVEHAAELAADRLRAAAEEHGAYEIVARLDALQRERRYGVSDDRNSSASPEFRIDIESLPRSTDSGRRVGMWR